MKDVRDERGQAIALVGLLLSTILLGLGLSVDVGKLLDQRRAGQIAADAGAFAGAVKLYNAGTNAQARTEAIADVTRNGFTDGVAGAIVTVSSPPASGTYAGNVAYVLVTVTQSVSTTFFRAVRPTTTITTTAVGGLIGCGGTPHSIHVLEASTNGAYDLSSGSTHLVASGSGIYVNSTGATSATDGGAGSGTDATYIRLVGNASAAVKGRMSPAPLISYLPVEGDPISCLTRPTSPASASGTNLVVTTPMTIGPGRYDGGIRVNNGGVLTLTPGVYVLRGGGSNNGLTTTGTGSISTQAGGVLIFNTNRDYPLATGSCGPINLNAPTGTVNMVAQRTGTYAGLLLWDDSVCAANQNITVTASWTAFTGTVYTPSLANFFIVGQSASRSLTTQFVTRRFRVSNNFTLTLSYDASLFYRRYPALVE